MDALGQAWLERQKGHLEALRLRRSWHEVQIGLENCR